jgi:hypothetical protein
MTRRPARSCRACWAASSWEITHNADRFAYGGGRSEREGYRPKAGAEDLATLPDGHAAMVHRNDLPAIVRRAARRRASPVGHAEVATNGSGARRDVDSASTRPSRL